MPVKKLYRSIIAGRVDCHYGYKEPLSLTPGMVRFVRCFWETNAVTLDINSLVLMRNDLFDSPNSWNVLWI